jgi:glycosyltransferase involved in cell wall biosynthesis
MISVLAYISLAFLSLRFMAVLVNFFFHLGRPRKGFQMNQAISILIPARNEEKNIGRILDCILNQDYTRFEVVVCDDHSTDSTPEILEDFSREHKEVKWFRGEALPPGWTGKNFACHQLAAKATGEILLFMDADVEIYGNIISSAQGYMKKRKLALLSIFPRQLMKTAGERASVPVMNWILLSLLPLPMVVLGLRSSFSAANGQFMMFRAHVYHKLQPHAIVRTSAVEDIEIMRLYKKSFHRCATQLGDQRVQCRMYTSYREAIAGFSKNVLHFFSGSLLWMLFFIVFTTFGLVFIGLWNLPVSLLALGISVLSRMLISLISHQDVLNNLLLVPVQHVSFLWMVQKALAQKSKGSLLWKGREIPVK